MFVGSMEDHRTVWRNLQGIVRIYCTGIHLGLYGCKEIFHGGGGGAGRL